MSEDFAFLWALYVALPLAPRIFFTLSAVVVMFFIIPSAVWRFMEGMKHE